MSAQLQVGEWAWSQAHQQHVKVIESAALWGQRFYRVWLQQQDSVVRVPAKDLTHATSLLTPSTHYVTYIGVAAKIANAQQEDILLAPVESNIIPLPHQLKALDKAMSRRQVRYLFADEVGLGKTIEAGLVMRELKLRGMAKRILVCAPKGLVSQWVSEMQTHFNETFHLLFPGEQKPPDENDNVWLKHDLVVCPVDSIKPIENRKGWSIKQVHEYNKHRFDDLLAAGWDLIVIDEAHRLGGSTELVARYKLGQGLAEASPYLLLLSATPHQGKSDAFHRLMALLDKEAFPDESSVTKERVQPYVVRTEKRISIDGQGQPLFKPRKTELVPVAWGSKHALQRHLYQEVTEYVKEGYNRAKAKKQNAIGFLMILMQRLVSSSSAAIAMTLSRRLQSLENTVVEDELPLAFADDWAELDGQAQLDELIASTKQALENEKADVQRLLNIANDCVSKESDTKAEALIDWLYKLQQEEQDPNLKTLVFTEFVPTQQMLSKFFRDRGISVVTLNGSMDLAERKKAQADFEHSARILISTDAGGEGLNLQFCHVIVNYDIPWNPMRMEQRIGRVDRIGQKHTVRALNFVLEDSVEHRVRDVLESKLQIILDEFGVDKTSDVLDSAEANHLFDELFMESISNPETMDQELAKALRIIQSGAQDKKAQDGLFSDGTPLNANDYQKLINHPLPFWVQKMVESYLIDKSAQGLDAKFIRSADGTIAITWPDGTHWDSVTFSGREAQQNSTLTHITLEHPKVRGLSTHLSIWNEQQSIPAIHIPSLPNGATGFWSLWSVRFSDQDERQMQYVPIYINSAGQYFSTASNRIWDAICTDEIQVVENDEEAVEVASLAYVSLRETAEKQGKFVFEAMCSAFLNELEQRIEKGKYSFTARQNAIERIGLPEVSTYRLRQLESEYRQWQLEIEQKRVIYPELNLHLVLEIKN